MLLSTPAVSAAINASEMYGKSLPNSTCDVGTNSRSAPNTYSVADNAVS